MRMQHAERTFTQWVKDWKSGKFLSRPPSIMLVVGSGLGPFALLSTIVSSKKSNDVQRTLLRLPTELMMDAPKMPCLISIPGMCLMMAIMCDT